MAFLLVIRISRQRPIGRGGNAGHVAKSSRRQFERARPCALFAAGHVYQCNGGHMRHVADRGRDNVVFLRIDRERFAPEESFEECGKTFNAVRGAAPKGGVSRYIAF